MSADILQRLAEVLKLRKTAAVESSYVASLYHKGLNEILKKLGEEAIETVLAACAAAANKSNPRARNEVIKETADLWFHSLVMLSYMDIELDELTTELERRFGVSGHTEKTRRNQP